MIAKNFIDCALLMDTPLMLSSRENVFFEFNSSVALILYF